ncbi:uridine kinase family protein [Qipengyuania qiaonensis]|uniref:Phosphoribulokinase/uridine kinase domain-containing protein n=1 Tax=Qipengyuania qiaonensis TaxID=2867240 RepID=A0ABS7JDX4_9SPHN|nr:hypothetical protein [Qipengyuania qiaonensis]MBX7484049.1 hypothetical protein [Qipengyuania qiaonensis]
MDANSNNAIRLIEQAKRQTSRVIVAVDGRSGVGKSTFAAALAAESGAVVVEGDDFYAGGVEVRGDTAEQRADACIDRPKLIGVLQQLRSGMSVTYRPFDWEAFDGSLESPARIVSPADVVIVEGVYAGHPDLCDLTQVRILLRVPDELRHQRLIAREGSIGPWERQWHEAEAWYFSRLATTANFDLVIG